MPPIGSGIYSPAMGPTNLGYDPSLAEEYSARQREYAAQQLARLAQMGQTNAQAIQQNGQNLAQGITGAVSGYYQGKKMAQDSQAAQMKQALSEEELKNTQADSGLLDQPISGDPGAPTVRASLLTQKNKQAVANVAKTEEETDALKNKGDTEKPVLVNTTDKNGNPIQTFVTPKSGLSFSGKPEREKPVLVQTTDDQGNPVQKFVTPSPGVTLSGKPEKEKPPAKISGTAATQIGSYDSAINMIDSLKKQYDKQASGTGSNIKSLWPGSEADKYTKSRNAAAQTIGTILEGGKLSDKDYSKYENMLPNPSDRNEVAAQKIATLKNLIASKKQGALSGLKDAQYDVSGFGPVNAGTGMAQTSPDGTATAATGARTVMKKEYSPSRKSTRVTYSDGTQEVVPDAQQ